MCVEVNCRPTISQSAFNLNALVDVLYIDMVFIHTNVYIFSVRFQICEHGLRTEI